MAAPAIAPHLTERPALDICIASPGLAHHGSTLSERSLGGSETATIYFAAAFARRGQSVTVFSPGHQGGLHGTPPVVYRPWEQCIPYVTSMPHDVMVVCRDLDLLRFRPQAKLLALWCHDLAHKRASSLFGGALWNVDHVVVLSDFQRRQYLQVHEGCPESLFVTARNGVNLDLAAQYRDLPRDPYRLVYGSRPERGLEAMLAVMERLGRLGSPLTLSVCWYDHPPQANPLQPYYEALFQKAQQLPNVQLLGPQKEADFYRLMASSLAVVYPGHPGEFREISCLCAMMAAAVGTPVVAINQGALPETLGAGTPDCGAILLGDETTNPAAPGYVGLFADTLETLRQRPDLWRALSEGGRRKAAGLGWDGVAEQMEAEWCGRLATRSADAQRLATHLGRRGDREALAALHAA